MKKHLKLIALLLPFVLVSYVTADERIVQLKDGSQIRGEVVGMMNGEYVIQSPTLGTLRLASDKIVSITLPSAAPNPSAAAGAGASALESIQSTIASDPGLMARIMSLQQDPQMQAVLGDPEIMGAVQRLDFEALRNNPRFRALMESSNVREITSKLQ
ncbi:MAG: hypothetical protein ACFHX7_22570 [Pseudomonadota bacterium]